MAVVVVATVVLTVVAKWEGMLVKWHEESGVGRALKRNKKGSEKQDIGYWQMSGYWKIKSRVGMKQYYKGGEFVLIEHWKVI